MLRSPCNGVFTKYARPPGRGCLRTERLEVRMKEHSAGTAIRQPRWRVLSSTIAMALVVSAVFAASAGAQVNGARLGIGPTMPTTTTVGAKGLPVYISLTNLSEPTDGTLIIPADAITFTPSCGSLPGGAQPPCPTPDPGVFAVGAAGTGRAGTNCAGQAYTIAQTSPPTGEANVTG